MRKTKELKKSQLTQFVLKEAIEKCFERVGLSEQTIAKLWMDIIESPTAKEADKLRASENLMALLGPKAKKQLDIDVEGDLSGVLGKFEKRTE